MNARIERLKELLKQSPHDAFIRFALAKEFEKLGDTLKAIELLTLLLYDQPEYVGAYYHLAALLKDEERTDEAMDVYIKGMEIAKKLGDQHAFSELQNAKLNMELED
ncbi:MAG: hypothetical protein R2728_12180 [Chitinophagales bacterium]